MAQNNKGENGYLHVLRKLLLTRQSIKRSKNILFFLAI